MNESVNPLPPGWTWTTLGEIIEFQYGKGLTESKRDQVGSIPVYGSNGVVGYHSVALVNEPCLVVGRKGAAGEVHISRGPCWPIDTTYFVFTPEGLNLSFAYYLLRTFRLGSLDRSTAIPGLNRNDAYSIPFGLPPLPEQHRIVEKIEALFSELDKGVEQLKTAAQQLKVYRQSVLKAAFEGKLTEEWRKSQNQNSQNEGIGRMKMRTTNSENSVHPENSDSDNLLTRIKQEREALAQTTGKRLKPIAPLTEKELAELPELPDGWAWVRLSELAHVQIGPFGSQLHQHDYRSEGIPIVNPKHISEQKISPDEKISKEKAKSLARYLLKENDIILGRRGEMGRSAPISKASVGWYCGTGSLFIRLVGRLSAKLYSLVLSERRVVNYLGNHSRGTTMMNLNSQILNSLPIQVIPIAEQHQIVQEIESRLSVCDKLEETIAASLQQSEALRQSILKKAFEGKLVEQDPNDPPASQLLEQIKRQKQEDNTGIAKRTKKATSAGR